MTIDFGAIARELAGWVCALVVLGGMVGLLIWLTRRQSATTPRTTCRRCGYDVRETPDRCPECGATVPDEIRLRIDLLRGEPPAFLLDDDHALPLREPAAGERFRPLVLLEEKHRQQVLTTLLRRSGIASEVDLRLMPRYAREVFRPVTHGPTRPAFEVSVPEADYPVAAELLAYVYRTTSPADGDAMASDAEAGGEGEEFTPPR